MKIYPGACTNLLTINMNDYRDQIVCCKILDVTGECLISKEINSNADFLDIDVSGLANGVYILYLKTSKGVKMEMFVVTK